MTQQYKEEVENSSNAVQQTPPDYRRESSPLYKLFDSAKMLDPRKQLKPGSKRASTLTVITSMVGGGTLALPYAMKHSGLIPTLIYFPLISSMCAWSLHCVILIGQKTNANTFYDIANVLFGTKVAIVIELLLVSILMLASVGYLTMVKNLLPYSLRIIFHTDVDCFWTGKEFLIPALTFVVISPLALMPKVAALRYASLCGFCLVFYLTIVTVYTYFDYCNKPYGHGCLTSSHTEPSVFENVDLWGVNWVGHMYTIPLIISSFSAHPCVLPIYIELRQKSPKDMWVVMVTGLTIAALVYMVLATFGYFTFLSDTDPNYLLNEYHHNVAVTFASVGLCLVCSLAIPLFIHAKRRSITTLYFNHFAKKDTIENPLLWNRHRVEGEVSSNWETQESESDFLSGSRMVETPELAFAGRRPDNVKTKPSKPTQSLPCFANLIITYGFLIFEASVSLYVSNIGVVQGLIGSTNFPICCYVFPAFALWKLRAQNPDDKDIDNRLLFIVTSSAVIVSILAVLGLLEEFKVIT